MLKMILLDLKGNEHVFFLVKTKLINNNLELKIVDINKEPVDYITKHHLMDTMLSQAPIKLDGIVGYIAKIELIIS